MLAVMNMQGTRAQLLTQANQGAVPSPYSALLLEHSAVVSKAADCFAEMHCPGLGGRWASSRTAAAQSGSKSEAGYLVLAHEISL